MPRTAKTPTAAKTVKAAKVAKVAKTAKAVKAPAKAAKAVKPVKTAKVAKSAAATGELVPLLVYLPRRARERLNKLVRDMQLANQAEAITKLVNDASKKA